jgi:arylsulfatase
MFGVFRRAKVFKNTRLGEISMRDRVVQLISRMASSMCAVVFAVGATSMSGQGKKPNVVVIMTDDVGWGDLGSYGGGAMRGAPTTNLDRMATEGMRFVNYYG